MKLFSILSIAALAGCAALSGGPAFADSLAGDVRSMELRGEGRAARKTIESAIRANPRDLSTLQLWAEFLDDRRDPGARAAWENLLAAAGSNSVPGKAAIRRLVEFDLLAGDREKAASRLGRLAQGAGALQLPANAPRPASLPAGIVEIPGPIRSFARMAALSPDLAPEDILLALARNVVTNGYQAVSGSESLEQTEYLKLVVRYLSQAREVDKLTGPDKLLRIEQCDSPKTGELLKILGFRMRGGCGADVVLETVNATRAFLSMDSGFPLADLEQALRTNRPFTYNYAPAKVPVLYSPEYWLSSREKTSGEFVDAMISDPAMCRLYLGLAKLDPETAGEIRRALPVTRIRAFAHVFDFFGGMFRIRDGKANVPGAARSAAAWADLVGAPPDQGVVFIEKLVTRDDGWLASYFDALMRISGPAQEYLTQPARMKRFYAALRGRVTSPGPARPVFRANTDLMLLTTRLQIAGGKPHIPGSLEVWKQLFTNSPGAKYDGKLTKSAAGWKEADDLVEALFGLSRKAVENEPLKIFLAVSDLDRHRRQPLSASTVDRLARGWKLFGAQYPLLNETPALTDETMLAFLGTAERVGAIGDNVRRADTAGVMQALAGLWQVLVRHQLIPESSADAALRQLLEPLGAVKSNRELFDAGRDGVMLLLKAAAVPAGANVHDRMMDLLAGAVAPKDEETHQLLLAEMIKIFEAQKLVSLKTLFDLADHLESLSKGEKLNTALLNRLAARVSDLNLPKASLSAQEKNSFAFGYWTEKHLDAQRKLNFRSVIEKAAGQPERLRDARGLLAPLLRDTLVGLLYIHYAPPGAQVLYTNPLFARSHDFIGIQGNQQTWKGTEVLGSGWPSSAGGRLVGSLAQLPYALAEAEQNFLIPTREQALIWGDLVPQMLVSSKLPRFWNVQPAQTHFVALSLRLGESALATAALDATVRAGLMETLEPLAPPARVKLVNDFLAAGLVPEALENVTPSELYALGQQARSARLATGSSAGTRLDELANAFPALCSREAMSNAFGTPKPTLANRQHPELLNLRTFPTLMGYSSRILAESWESNNLFFAALSDELSLQPSQLNTLLPEWTQKTVEQIFATHLEDWPALLRSMRVVAERVRADTLRIQALETKAAAQQ